MKLSKPLFAVFLLSNLSASSAFAAHCACGGEAFPGAALSAETVGIGSVALTTGFGYNQYEVVSAGDFEDRARKSGGRHEGPSSISAANLGISWGLGESWQLGLNQSWQRMSDYREGFINGSGTYEFYNHGTLGGFKDLDLSVKGRIWKLSFGSLAVQGNLALPSGQQVNSPYTQVDSSGNSAGSIARPLPGWVQPGRGAWDSSISGIFSMTKAWFLMDLSLSQNFPVSAGDYSVGQRLSLAAALGLRYLEHHTVHLDVISTQSKQDTFRGKTVWATGGAFEGLGLRSTHPITQRTQLALQLMLPLLYNTAGQEGTRVSVQGAARIATLF